MAREINEVRILMVGPFPSDPNQPIGGVESSVVNLVNGLRQIPSLEVDVISNSERGSFGERQVDVRMLGVTFIPQRPGLKGWFRDLHVTLVREVVKGHWDVIHVQGVASVAARLPGAFLTVHGLVELDAWASRTGVRRLASTSGIYALEGIPRRRARKVISVSAYISNQFRDKRAKLWEIPNPIHPGYFCSDREVTRGNREVFIQAATVSPLKNTAGLIEAFRTVADESGSAQLLLAGGGLEGNYAQYCMWLVQKLRLRANVHFLGHQSRAALSKLLFEAGTLVQFSNQENAPVAISEGLASGAAVTASAVGGIPSMLAGLPGCRLVVPGCVGGLARQLICGAQQEGPADAGIRHAAALKYDPIAVARMTYEAYRDGGLQ